MRVLTAVAGEREDGRAVRSAVPRLFSLGTHEFRRLKQQGGILVNGETARADRLLAAGDVVEVRLRTDEAGEPRPASSAPEGCRILYMDGDLIVLSKPAPLPTLPSVHQRGGTLREALCALLGADEATYAFHPVNRLDKGTSGLMAAARHAHAQRLLAAELHGGGFLREYLAVTDGVPPEEEGEIDAPIARLGAGARRCVRADGKPARTFYRVVSVSGGRALLRLRLATGRTHQIRVHLASIGCPVTGDYLYGTPHPALPDRFALHSARLTLTHPLTGERLSFDDEPPAVFPALLSPADARP